MHHMGSDFPRFTEFAIKQDIRFAIGGRSLLEKSADFLQWILNAQQRTMGLMPDALENRFGRTPQTDHKRVSFEADEIFWIRHETAAGGNNKGRRSFQLLYHLLFVRPEARLAFRVKDVRNFPPGNAFDHFVRIDKPKAQHACNHLANCALARAHEPHQRDILKMATFGHLPYLTKRELAGTLIFPKNVSMLPLLLAASLLVAAPLPEKGIASRYPGDRGIDSDAKVVFSENFEQSNLE
jgi:hypothetical protein